MQRCRRSPTLFHLSAALGVVRWSDIYLQGAGDVTKTDEFSKKFQRRGVIFNPKNYVAEFGPLDRALFGRFPKKWQHDFPKMRGGRVKGTYLKIYAFW